MKRSAHASVSPFHPLSLACLTLVAAGAFSCSGEGGGEAGAAEATVEIEWHNPELKRAKTAAVAVDAEMPSSSSAPSA